MRDSFEQYMMTSFWFRVGLVVIVLLFVLIEGGKNEPEIISPLSDIQPTSTPTATPTPSKKALATWYCGVFDGRRTASGEIYDCDELTAANNELPFGTVVRLTNGSNSVEVTINDRGGFKEYGRTFDLSMRAFEYLAPLSVGVLEVEWEIVK